MKSSKPTQNEDLRIKRLNISLTPKTFKELEAIAEEKGTSIVDVIRQSISLALIVFKAAKEPDTKIIIREGDKEKEVIFL